MTKEYLLEDLQRLFEKTRTQALRFAQLQGWTVEKKKIGKVYKNVYKASEVDAYRASLVEVKEEKEKKVATRTVAKREATAIDELPSWNQRVANARFILCMKLEEKYEEGGDSKEEIIKKFVKEANKGKGIKVASWMRLYMSYVLPVIVFLLIMLGLFWKG